MSRAADVARQARARGVRAAVPLLVTPGSEQIRATIERDGQLRALRGDRRRRARERLRPVHRPVAARRGRGRRAQRDRDLLQPQLPAPQRRARDDAELHREPGDRHRVRARGNARLRSAARRAHRRRRRAVPARAAAARAGGSRRAASRARASALRRAARGRARHRAARSIRRASACSALAPWPAWDGGDFVGLPLLLKTQGKTTTDHISPAGPWLRYRGHLDKFSDNLFLGARDAFTGETRARRRAARARVPGRRLALGRRRRSQLRRGQQPRARRALAAPARRRRRDRAQLRAHSRDRT